MENYDIKRVQSICLDILKEVVRVCEENNITYFLDSGTALGAVRHGGFIPWDDDIDIAMDRENYEKFLEVAPTSLRAGYTLQSPKYDKNCPYPFSKVRKDGTIYMDWNKRNMKMHHGIYIDIFPFDNSPDNEKELAKHFSKCRFWINLYKLRIVPDRSAKPQLTVKWFVGDAVRKLLHIIVKIVPVRLIIRRLESLFNKYNGVETEFITCYVYSRPWLFRKSDLFPVRRIRFEDAHFFCMKNPHSYLSTIYGDYMQLPPVEHRRGHAPFRVKY